MSVTYDKYYQTSNLFGEPYPELVVFFSSFPSRGSLLDLGCGQGRDAIALSRMGYVVTGVDNSLVGIEQMNHIAQTEGLELKGTVDDIFEYQGLGNFDFILLDSMFHFGKKEKKREIQLVERVVKESRKGTFITFCIQNTGNKLKILDQIIDTLAFGKRVIDLDFHYTFEDKESNHRSKTPYRMVVIEK